ncbi:thioesterase superfamily protein [Herbihabitans rhizosphaerae]|uniref:Thioesterase superfamily protein n=1 Tax=Herbihabitans rhizosphaerae TaxID=1872711 RepID=A0A4Q7KDE2_9PSEU|nr:alpha/beta fold hydrolase [Herbihabitans rhizosphaerae]RZS31197.1 thioesterase superfamily protein [Herbihabitans rhizosphaerae]
MHDTTVVRRRRNPDATRRLICRGFCGGGAASYLEWDDKIGPENELAAICYPGREGRFTDEFAENWDELVADTTEAVLSATDIPYVLFGHSMGGWMAFDVTAGIERAGKRPPEALVVFSANAPSRGLTERDMLPGGHFYTPETWQKLPTFIESLNAAQPATP